MIVDLPKDLRGQDPYEVYHYLLTKRLGSEIDYVVKGIDRNTGLAVGSRKDAMATKRRHYYLNQTRDGTYRIYEGLCCEARVMSVIPYGIFVDLFGIDVYIPLRELSYVRLTDAMGYYEPGDRVLVKVTQALSYLRQKGLSTVEDLEAFLESSGKSAADYRSQMKPKEARSKVIDGLLSARTDCKECKHTRRIAAIEDGEYLAVDQYCEPKQRMITAVWVLLQFIEQIAPEAHWQADAPAQISFLKDKTAYEIVVLYEDEDHLIRLLQPQEDTKYIIVVPNMEFANKLILPDAPCLFATVDQTECEAPKITFYSS